MDFWVIVAVVALGVVVAVLLTAEARRLFVAWDRFARQVAASRPDAVVVLAQMRPDLPPQLRMLARDAGIRDQSRDDIGVAVVVDATTVEVYREPGTPPVFSCPTGHLVRASLAEHTALSVRTGRVIRRYPSLRLVFDGPDAVGDLDLVPFADARPAFLAAKPRQIDAVAARLRDVAGLSGGAAS